MKIKNNGEKFDVIFNNERFEVPKGDMEIPDDKLGIFILTKARFWKKDVVKTENSVKASVEPIDPISPIEVIKDVPVEEEKVKEEPKKKTTKK